MIVSVEIQSRVNAKVADCIARAEAKYQRKFTTPQVAYELRGAVAGYADYRKNVIRLNATLLSENVSTFIERTVPHELAHLIDRIVHPDSHEQKLIMTVSGRRKWSKRDVHGATWQSVCHVLGMSDVTRCHSYDVTNSKVVKSNSRQIKWQCGCGAVLTLSPKKSAVVDANPSALWHRSCRGVKLTRITPAATPLAHDARETGSVALPVNNGSVSKIDLCRVLYLSNRSASRSQLISLFINKAGCTAAGASTYHHTLKKAHG